MIPIYKPFLDKYKHSAISAIQSEWISNYGMYVDLASEELKKYLNIPYCILMNNGTSATHALFKALKFKHPEIKKLYVPNNVFIAPYNCALMEYDSTQLEVMKINPDTFNIDPRAFANDGSAIGRHETYVGLSGGFGNLRLGAVNTASLGVNGVSNVFGTATGGAYAWIESAAGGAVRFNRSVS